LRLYDLELTGLLHSHLSKNAYVTIVAIEQKQFGITMKKLATAVLLSAVILPVQATDLPSMCFDGTYAGGEECEIVINGEKVRVGLEPDEFFQSDNEIAEDLGEIFKDVHDKIAK